MTADKQKMVVSEKPYDWEARGPVGKKKGERAPHPVTLMIKKVLVHVDFHFS